MIKLKKIKKYKQEPVLYKTKFGAVHDIRIYATNLKRDLKEDEYIYSIDIEDKEGCEFYLCPVYVEMDNTNLIVVSKDYPNLIFKMEKLKEFTVWDNNSTDQYYNYDYLLE